ncbi:MAG: NAD-dependent epimerase/dehydratase family protein [Actinomycetales bacterium]
MIGHRTLVIGAGGLLGQQVMRQVPGAVAVSDVPWEAPARAKAVLRQQVRDIGPGPWNVAWCSGSGVVATPAGQIEQERELFREFLTDLAEATVRGGRGGRGGAGALFFASSAGGVYADSAGPPFTETSAPRPRTPYGIAKLAMEADVRAFAEQTGTPVLIGRIANLYGPGQNLAKPQGLVSQICLTHLSGQPLSLYVPMDTRRDYLYVEDCARMVAAGLAELRERAAAQDGPLVVTKILASGRTTTVGGLLGESARLFRRRPRVVLGASSAASAQVLDLSLRSTEWAALDRLARTPLPVGIARTAADVAQRLRLGGQRLSPAAGARPAPGRSGG